MKYVALLRAINVAGHQPIKMAELVRIFSGLGLSEVRTHIASGNVIFESTDRNEGRLRASIERGIARDLGFEIDVILRTSAEIAKTVRLDPFKGIRLGEKAKGYVTLLAEKTGVKLEPFVAPKGEFRVLRQVGREVFSVSHPLKGGRFGNPVSYIEKRFETPATTRNWNTIRDIAGLF